MEHFFIIFGVIFVLIVLLAPRVKKGSESDRPVAKSKPLLPPFKFFVGDK
jgi:hypothetical protein